MRSRHGSVVGLGRFSVPKKSGRSRSRWIRRLRREAAIHFFGQEPVPSAEPALRLDEVEEQDPGELQQGQTVPVVPRASDRGGKPPPGRAWRGTPERSGGQRSRPPSASAALAAKARDPPSAVAVSLVREATASALGRARFSSQAGAAVEPHRDRQPAACRGSSASTRHIRPRRLDRRRQPLGIALRAIGSRWRTRGARRSGPPLSCWVRDPRPGSSGTSSQSGWWPRAATSRGRSCSDLIAGRSVSRSIRGALRVLRSPTVGRRRRGYCIRMRAASWQKCVRGQGRVSG